MNDNIHMNIDHRRIKKNLRRGLVLLLAGLISLFFGVCISFADVDVTEEADTAAESNVTEEGQISSRKTEGYELQQYYMDVKVNKDHSYDIELNLRVRIPGDDFQRLSVRMPNGNFRLTGLNVEGGRFEHRSDKLLITGGEGESGIEKGVHDYRITYRIVEYAEHNTARDMFYFDAVEPDWDVPINLLRITIELPEDFVWDDLRYYAGQFGVQDVTDMLTLETSGNKVTLTGSKLPQNFGITFKAQLPDGYWVGALDNSWTINTSVFLMLGILALIFILWLIGGRDPKAPKTVEQRPIEGISPVDIGFLFNGRTRIRDIIILLVDFAAKGYLRIVEFQPKQYRLIRLEEPKEEARYIRNFYNSLFEGVYEGRALGMEEIEPRLRQLRGSLEASIESGYSAQDMRAKTRVSEILRVISIAVLSAGIGAVYACSRIYLYQSVSIPVTALLIVCAAASLILINWRYERRYGTEKETFIMVFTAGILAYCAVLGYAAWSMSRSSGQAYIAVIIGIFGFAAMLMTLIMTARGKGNAELVGRILALRHFMLNSTIRDLAPLIVEGEQEDTYYRELQAYALLFSIEEVWGQKFRWLRAASPYYYEEEIEGSALSRSTSEKSMAVIARELRTFIRTLEGDYHRMSRQRRA
ncbi:MAG: DUF2207 domain-containing protein [Mogibacterium sp.]|nr:DUF2207 domain-containing protein [Mogibacterium sp.]